MKGLIYCFNTLGDSKILKAGHTTTSLAKRFGGYLGLSKPRTIFFSRQVEDSAFAEELMLTLMRQCVSITPRDDLGDEWFETCGAYSWEDRQRHLEFIAKVAQMATRGRAYKPEPMVRKTKTIETGDTTLRGLEDYFCSFDAYVKVVSFERFDSAETLMSGFEQSEHSPYGKFAQYLPFNEETRLKVVRNRYSSLLA